MPDWNAVIRQRLGRLGLDAGQQDAIVAELAGHLEEVYEQGLAEGQCKSDAMERSLEEVADWRRLARDIRHAKREEGIVNYRTKSFWFPGLVSLTAFLLFMAALTPAGLEPRHLGPASLPHTLYFSWLALLPLCGAAGAWLSRRAGDRRSVRLAAGLFPSIIMFALGAFLTLSGWVVLAKPQWFYGLLALCLGLVLPAIALTVGALPFLRSSKQTAVEA